MKHYIVIVWANKEDYSTYLITPKNENELEIQTNNILALPGNDDKEWDLMSSACACCKCNLSK